MDQLSKPARRRIGPVFAALAVVLGLGVLFGAPASAQCPPGATSPAVADFGAEAPSAQARQIADWVALTGDNQGMPFIIVDKTGTKVFVFDAASRLRGATTALLGLARGDDSAPGVGDRKLADIPPEERTTPAGRFVASMGLNLKGQDILWVDYDTAIALHRVLAAGSRQSLLERAAARSPLDRRITFGCINVPVRFYEDVVRPQFVGKAGIVYILPETKSLQEVFFRTQNTAAGAGVSAAG